MFPKRQYIAIFLLVLYFLPGVLNGQILIQPIELRMDSSRVEPVGDSLTVNQQPFQGNVGDSLLQVRTLPSVEPTVMIQADTLISVERGKVGLQPQTKIHQLSNVKDSVLEIVTMDRMAKKIFIQPFNRPVVDSSYLEVLFQRDGLTDIRTVDTSIIILLQYSDTLNFLHKNLYDGLERGYLTCETAWRLAGAQYYLSRIHPGFRLVVLDATRPLHVQQMMWDSLKLSEHMKHFYLASPNTRSLHNYGRAVDVTIVDSTGTLLDMGTDFDAFTLLSAPEYEDDYLKKGRLTQQHLNNRQLLRKVMQLVGFKPIKSEWWHFNLGTIQEARSNHPVVR